MSQNSDGSLNNGAAMMLKQLNLVNKPTFSSSILNNDLTDNDIDKSHSSKAIEYMLSNLK